MLLRFIIALVLGLVAGAALSWNVVRTDRSFGSVTIGAWTAWPEQGSPEADPYLRARVAAEAIVPLGIAEGIEFEARTDTSGRRLDRSCNYVVEGPVPQARFWTLTAMEPASVDAGPRVVGEVEGNHALLHSTSLLREADGSAKLALGPRAAPGNWMRLRGTGSYRLVLRLYDAPAAGDLALLEPTMPSIRLVSCAHGARTAAGS